MTWFKDDPYYIYPAISAPSRGFLFFKSLEYFLHVPKIEREKSKAYFVRVGKMISHAKISYY